MYGVYSNWSKKWCFGIAEPTKSRAWKALYAKIGKDSYKWRFEIKKIPDELNVRTVNHKPKTIKRKAGSKI